MRQKHPPPLYHNRNARSRPVSLAFQEATVQAAVDLSSCSTQSLPLLDTSHTQTSPLRSDAASQVAVPAAHPPLAPDRPPPTHAHHTQTRPLG